MTKRTAWRVCVAALCMLSVVTFTPLVLPLGEAEPALWGLPYTLWTGILVTLGMVGLTYVATQLYPPTKDGSETW